LGLGNRLDRRRWYSRKIDEYPILNREDEAALVQCVRNAPPGDPSAHRLVLSNLGFVVKIANEYRNLGIPFDDLLNEGNIGVLEAARHFDPSRGTRFLTYAVWWIRKAMLRALARQVSLVQVPAYQLRKLRSVTDVESRLSKELGRGADREEVSREMQVTLSTIDAVLGLKSRDLSLDEPVGQDRNQPLSAGLADDRSVNPEEALIRNENQDLVRWALGRLTEEERIIIVARYDLEGDGVFTLQELGARLGVSRERIRQIEVRAKRRLRKAIALQRQPYAASRATGGTSRPATMSA
jgi:RNA polymerase sigma factor (sigma-70 family)